MALPGTATAGLWGAGLALASENKGGVLPTEDRKLAGDSSLTGRPGFISDCLDVSVS